MTARSTRQTEQAPRIPRDQRFNMRMSAHQRHLIGRAAAALDKTETDFMLEAATSAAERVLTDRRWFALGDEAWSRFEELLDAPVPYENDLRELLNHPTVFDS
ncbi:MAG: DUF1778 domain-containing protein [Acidimicrobiales bacterium]